MEYKIAIVDDDVSIITLVRGILGKEGMSVAPLTSGKALLDYIKVQTPDIILLDVMMPDMDGIETYMALRDIERELGTTVGIAKCNGRDLVCELFGIEI